MPPLPERIATPDAPAGADRSPAQTPGTFRDVRDMGMAAAEARADAPAAGTVADGATLPDPTRSRIRQGATLGENMDKAGDPNKSTPDG